MMVQNFPSQEKEGEISSLGLVVRSWQHCNFSLVTFALACFCFREEIRESRNLWFAHFALRRKKVESLILPTFLSSL
jgi:hypothetical protein